MYFDQEKEMKKIKLNKMVAFNRPKFIPSCSGQNFEWTGRQNVSVMVPADRVSKQIDEQSKGWRNLKEWIQSRNQRFDV